MRGALLAILLPLLVVAHPFDGTRLLPAWPSTITTADGKTVSNAEWPRDAALYAAAGIVDVETITNAVVTTNAAPASTIARAQQAATIIGHTNVAAIIAQAGTDPVTLREWIEQHAAEIDAATREEFRTLEELWPAVSPWCADGRIGSFTPVKITTNHVIEAKTP